MRFVIFTHSLVSDWNHGNAHFLRGIATELVRAAIASDVYEPLTAGAGAICCRTRARRRSADFEDAYPLIAEHLLRADSFDLGRALSGTRMS